MCPLLGLRCISLPFCCFFSFSLVAAAPNPPLFAIRHLSHFVCDNALSRTADGDPLGAIVMLWYEHPKVGERVFVSWLLFEILTQAGFTAVVKTLGMNQRFSFAVKQQQKKFRHHRIGIGCSGSKNTPSRKNRARGFEFSTSVVCGLRFMMYQPYYSPALFSTGHVTAFLILLIGELKV